MSVYSIREHPLIAAGERAFAGNSNAGLLAYPKERERANLTN